MYKTVKSCCRLLALVLFLAFFVAGCGGSSGDKSGSVVDPAPAFRGQTHAATLAANNAENLAVSAFSASPFGNNLSGFTRLSKQANLTETPSADLASVVRAFKLSALRMEIPRKARQARLDRSKAQKTAARNVAYQIWGDNGGTASFSLEINDSNSSFYGSVTYQGFTSRGTVIDGQATLLGTVDFSSNTLSSLTVSMQGVRVHSSTSDLDLTGALSWKFSLPMAELLSMNLVLKPQNGKTYWFNNYEISTKYYTSNLEQTMSGRYYDPDLGYVDLTTTQSIVAYYSSMWPAQGAIKVRGQSGATVDAQFKDTTLALQADFDNNGTADWQTERAANAHHSVNTIPVAQAGPDQNVQEWTEVHLDGSASSDAEGDPLSYSWSFVGSPGSAPSLSGADTATPSFTPKSPGTYRLSLVVYDGQALSEPASVTITVTAATPLHPEAIAQSWQIGTFGSSIGLAGLFTSDLDGDGVPEIIATGSTGGGSYMDICYVLHRTDSGGFQQVWRSNSFGAGIARVQLADLNGDGTDDLVIALGDGTIHAYDGSTFKEIRSYSTSGSLRDMALADLEGDGHLEIVTTDGIGIRVYSAETGALRWSIATGGGRWLAVGNVDLDMHQEIVTSTYGSTGYVVDGVTHSIKWQNSGGFGAKVWLAELNGNGRQMIVAAAPWQKITVFDAVQQQAAWNIVTSEQVDALAVADADGDGVLEIIYGDGQWGKVHGIDTQTHQEKWSIVNPQDGISGIAVADVDQDGKCEIVWGAGGYDSGADYLYVSDPLTGATKWRSNVFEGTTPFALTDLDGDGKTELAVVSQSSSSGLGSIQIFDARTHQPTRIQTLPDNELLHYSHAARVADLDGDGRSEFVLTADLLFDGLVRVYDGTTLAVKRQSATFTNTGFVSMVLGDVDGDGVMDIVVGQTSLIVLDGTTMQEKWRSPSLGANLSDVKLADLDGDGHLEIVAATGGGVFVYDGVTKIRKAILPIAAHAIDIADLDGDGKLELLAGRTDGKIDIYNGATFALVKTIYSFRAYSIEAMKAVDLDHSGKKKLVIASGSVITVLDGQALYWRSEILGNNLGRYNSIDVADTDGDGLPSIFIGSDQAFYQFKYLGQ